MSNKTQKSVPQNFRIRSQQSIHHHLFKALVSVFKKNVSWKSKVLDLHDVEHVHHFHSVNSHGMPQKFTNLVGGHFHEVTWDIGKDGVPVAKCGPAMRKVTRKTPVGAKTSNEIVQWETFHSETGAPIMIQDKHTHEMRYEGTDVITSEQIKATQKQNAEAAAVAQTMEMPNQFENDEVKMEPAGAR